MVEKVKKLKKLESAKSFAINDSEIYTLKNSIYKYQKELSTRTIEDIKLLIPSDNERLSKEEIKTYIKNNTEEKIIDNSRFSDWGQMRENYIHILCYIGLPLGYNFKFYKRYIGLNDDFEEVDIKSDEGKLFVFPEHKLFPFNFWKAVKELKII